MYHNITTDIKCPKNFIEKKLIIWGSVLENKHICRGVRTVNFQKNEKMLTRCFELGFGRI